MHEDAQRWNDRYTEDGRNWLTNQPRQLLLDYLPQLPKSGLALDAASGVGIHGLRLAEHGLHVIALDISEIGLRLAKTQAMQKGLKLDTAVYDLGHPHFPANSFDVIVNFRFLERATFPAYRRALKLGGWLIFETFVQTDTAVPHPNYFLKPNELQEAFADFEIIHSLETAVKGNRTQKMKAVAQLVARKSEM